MSFNVNWIAVLFKGILHKYCLAIQEILIARSLTVAAWICSLLKRVATVRARINSEYPRVQFLQVKCGSAGKLSNHVLFTVSLTFMGSNKTIVCQCIG